MTRDGAVVREDVAIQRIKGGIVDVGREDAFLEVIEHDDADGAAKTAKRLFMQFGQAPRTGVEGEQADALAAVAESEDEQPRAPILPGAGMPHHQAVAVINLPLFARPRDNNRVRLGGVPAAELGHEVPHAGVAAGEAVLIDEALPDRHGVATTTEGQFDQLTVRLAGAGLRRPTGPWRPLRQRGAPRGQRAGSVDTALAGCAGWVDTSLAGFGRGWPHRPGGRTARPAALR